MLSSGTWDTDSPKSSLLDSFATTATTSAVCTPETPLVATVRRCLKYSPETPGHEYNNPRSNDNSVGSGTGGGNRGAIEIECYAGEEKIHVKSEC